MSNRLLRAPEQGAYTWREMLERHQAPGNGLADMWWVDASFIMGLKPER